MSETKTPRTDQVTSDCAQMHRKYQFLKMRGHAKQLEKENADYESRLSSAQVEIVELTAANARIAELEGRLNTSRSDHSSCKSTCDRLREMLDRSETELARLKAEGDGWLPIESYDGPDKRSVLAYCSERMNTYTAYIEAGIWFHFAAGLSRLTEQPTHYRPLPPAPLPTPHNSNP